MEAEAEHEQEALRLKSLAETKFKSSNLKSALKYAKRAERLAPNLDGISEMVTSFKILREAPNSSGKPDWYKILQVEPFAHMNIIRKQYKKLALILHPDKNPYAGSEEAFKLVGEAFRLLSDKIRRKEYDMKLRIRLQEEAIESSKEGETFWTACSTCRLLHQFQRTYVGHNLVCPSCKKSFKAVEAENVDESEEEDKGDRLRFKDRSGNLRVSKLKPKTAINEKIVDLGLRRKMASVEKSQSMKEKIGGGEVECVITRTVNLKGKGSDIEARNKDLEKEGDVDKWSGGRLRSGGLRRRMSNIGNLSERSEPKRTKTGDEMMTLAEMQAEMKKKVQQQRMQAKIKEKEDDKTEKRSKLEERHDVSKNSNNLEAGKKEILKKGTKLAVKDNHGATKNNKYNQKDRVSSGGDLEIMAVEDSDFYDFDKDRVERSFKKGQVWAVYDDDDGMPRHYALIDEVVSLNPFEVKISWLDLQNSADEKMITWEKKGFHISCGRFKVAWKTSINSLNIFSHVVDCERAAREVYRIYPQKGSVWALYSEAAMDAEGRNPAAERCYDIVVFLTSFSEMNGLSVGYLEKVGGYKTIFKRKEIGSHAIRLLEKDEIWLISHQIPSRKLSGDETPELLKDCWELDPASLPSDLLTIGY